MYNAEKVGAVLLPGMLLSCTTCTRATVHGDAAVLTLIATDKDRMLLAILYYTGLRMGEALGLRWSDIDFSERTLRVERDIDMRTNGVGTVKTSFSIRTVPIPTALYDMLKAARGISDAYIIQAPRSGGH